MSTARKPELDRAAAPLERLSEEVTRKLSAVTDGLSKGIQPSLDDIDTLEHLLKLKTFLSSERARRRKQVELAALCAVAFVFIGLSFTRLPSTAVDLDVRATKVHLKIDQQRSAVLIPGEMGQILALKQARVSGADAVLPSSVGEGGSFEIREVIDPNRGSEDLTVRLQEISIPEGAPYAIAVGVAYAADSRGLTIETSGSRAAIAQFGEVIPVGATIADAKSIRYAIRPVRATGNNLSLELFPANEKVQLTVLRNMQVSEIIFEDDGNSTILGGSVYVKSDAETSISLQPSDRLTIRSTDHMLLRELTLTKGELRAVLSAASANTVQSGEDSPRNLIPTFFEWIRYRWPTQLYATLSALVAIWLAAQRWWGSLE
jgi:hypothetical protein